MKPASCHSGIEPFKFAFHFSSHFHRGKITHSDIDCIDCSACVFSIELEFNLVCWKLPRTDKLTTSCDDLPHLPEVPLQRPVLAEPHHPRLPPLHSPGSPQSTPGQRKSRRLPGCPYPYARTSERQEMPLLGAFRL